MFIFILKEGENIKRILSVSPMIIFILYGFLPIGHIIGVACEYDFVLRDYPISILALAAISIVVPVLLLSLKISLSKVQTVFSALLLPLSAINGMFFVFDSDWMPTNVFAIICCGCCIVMLVKFACPNVLKIISAVLSAILISFFLFFTFVDFIFGDFGSNTVVKSVVSPQNTYMAIVIDSDQGALGGDTFVDIRSNGKVINLLICEFSKSDIRVYEGGWGESERMQISWKDENTLIINNKEYYIND